MWGRLFQRVDIASLVFFRIAFGSILVWEVSRYFAYGWIGGQFIEPVLHFRYYGFEWLEAWPGDGMYLHFGIVGLAAACIALGLAYRVACCVFFLGFSYVFLIDQLLYLNHFYLICLLGGLMAFVPAHRSLSLDAWMRPGLRCASAPALALWLLRAQLAIVYAYAGLAKLNVDWLLGEPMRALLASRVESGALPGLFATEAMVYLFSYGGLLLDLLAAPLLLWSRTRPLMFVALVAFHLTNAWVFPIGIFPFLMIAATTLFFAPDWPRRFLGGRREEEPEAVARLRPWLGFAVLALVGMYLTAQLLVPLRHWLYRGEVSWTEEGHRFAWRMMLRSKTPQARFLTLVIIDQETGEAQLEDPTRFRSSEELGRLSTDPEAVEQLRNETLERWRKQGKERVSVDVERRFIRLTARDPASAREWNVDPLHYLSVRSEGLVARNPDMVHQLARHAAAQQEIEIGGPVEIRAEAWASLHGRTPQLLVDPRANLAARPRTLEHARWIVPLQEEWPPRRQVQALIEPD